MPVNNKLNGENFVAEALVETDARTQHLAKIVDLPTVEWARSRAKAERKPKTNSVAAQSFLTRQQFVYSR
jgi:hypothetical protein